MELTAEGRLPADLAMPPGHASLSWHDLASAIRAIAVSVVVGISVSNPALGLRQGALVCALVAGWALIDGAYRPKLVDALAVGFAAVAVTSLTWALDPSVSGLSARNFAGAVAVFVGVRAAASGLRTSRLVAYGFAAGAIYAATQLIFMGGVRFSFDERAERLGLDVARGASQNYLAYCFVGCLSVLMFIWITKRPRLLGRTVCTATAALMWLGVVQTGTRGALLGLLLFTLWAALQRQFPGRGLRWLLLAALGLQLVIVSGLLDDRMATFTGNRIRDTGTLNGRLELWPAAREVIADNPALGVGTGGFQRLSPLDAAAHNIALDIGTGLGLLGLGVFGWLVYTALVTETRHVSPSPRAMAVGGLVTSTLGATSSGFWVESPSLWALLALVSTLPTALGTQAEPSKNGPPTDPSRRT